MKKKGNKKMLIPRQEIIDNPIPTSLFFNKITCTVPSAKTVDFPLLHSLANISVMQ